MQQTGNGRIPAPAVYGITALQEGLLSSTTESVLAGARNIRMICTVRGNLDPVFARAAFDRLVERHEMLRTFYTRDMSGAWHCATGASLCDFDIVGWQQLSAMPFEDHINRESARPFDLENGPLLRVRLYAGAANAASLLLCAPFIAADLTSLRILIGEFESVYVALRTGGAPNLPALRGNYFDYVQHSRMESRARQAGAAPGAKPRDVPALDLPFDYLPSANGEDSQGEIQFGVSASVAESLSLLTSGSDTARSGVFLAAFAILLSRYSANERIPLALPVNDRTVNTRNAVGNYLRLEPALLECAQQGTFRELLDQTASAFTEALHAGSAAQFPRGENGSNRIEPPCSAWFAWESGGRALRLCTSSSFEPVEAECLLLPGLFALGLRVNQTEGFIRGSLVYRRDRFARSTIARMSRQYLQLLASIGDRPDGLIGEFEILPEEEEQEVLACSAGPHREFLAARLHELFAQQAAWRPDAEALVFGAQRLTYSELDRRSNQVAQFLRTNGLRQQEIVGVCMEPSADWVVALVGILKAGGAYAPIDPKFPAERVAFMIEDMMARWVLTSGPTPGETRSAASRVSLNDPHSGVAGSSCEPVPDISTPDSPAVLIYSSGATGNPKGTLIPHRAVIRAVQERNFVDVTHEDRVAQLMPASFDVCIFEVWTALTNGATLVGISKNDLLAPPRMASILTRERVTFMYLPAAYICQIGRENPGMLGNLRTVFYGGAPADPTALHNILRAGPPGKLVNAYGSAEGCILASCYGIGHVDEEARSIPLGRPLTNVNLYLLDANLRPVPFGVPGEICIGGNIALGYWRCPELTRQKFIPDFISGKEGAAFYRTGDMARRRADGNLEFLGRTEDQVKVRGFRIELGAIQIALASHPDVSDAVVIVREDQPGVRRLVGYVTLRREVEHVAEILRRHVQSRVPEYMVPGVIVPLDSIPLNANGKVDKTALTAPRERPEIATVRETPMTQLQQAVATVWRELLGVENVSLRDDFFELGGDSLLAMRLTVSLREAFGIPVALQALFSSKSLGEFCAALEAGELVPGRLEKLAGILNRIDRLSPLEFEEALRSLDFA
ncbi:MAG TPA: amino acid adenylation domain-containing protein [Bryobacteraceae bacterium]